MFYPFRFLISMCALATAGSVVALSTDDVVKAMRSVPVYEATARFVVSMPQMSDDVVYAMTLRQQSQPSDTLLGVDYLVGWKSVSGTAAPIDGFSAYCAGGDHYRYNGHRMHEYHLSADPSAFVPEMGNAKGVHLSAQFVDFLPVVIANSIERMLADSSYYVAVNADTLVDGRMTDVVRGTLTLSGVTAQEVEYVLDNDTHMPLRVRQENSPGTISEQSVEVVYTPVEAEASAPLTEEVLMELYSDVFANLRRSNFRIQSMPGTRLPGFSLPTATSERYSRGVNDSFRAPTVVALLNAADAMTGPTVDAIRGAAEGSPVAMDILWVISDKDAEAAENAVGAIREGEHLLINGRTLMRDCGAADLPAIIVCDDEGVVRHVIVGFNNNLTSDVIQMVAVM